MLSGNSAAEFGASIAGANNGVIPAESEVSIRGIVVGAGEREDGVGAA